MSSASTSLSTQDLSRHRSPDLKHLSDHFHSFDFGSIWVEAGTNRSLSAPSRRETSELTQHDERGGPLLVPRGVGGVLAGVAAGIGHLQVRDADGRVLQALLRQEGDSALEGRVGETLSVYRVVNGDVVPLTIDGFPDPGHLETTET